METTTMTVAVHKANVPLLRGESVNDFTSSLGKDAREYLMKKMNVAPYASGATGGVRSNVGGAWLVEAFSDRVVMAMYKGSEPTRYYAFKYSRDKKGMFDFGTTTEVRRVTSFVPKDDIPVTKNNVEKEEDDTEKGCGAKTRKSDWGDWEPLSKSLWANVI